MIYYSILQCYDNITAWTLETLCNHATNLDTSTMKALTVPISFPVSTIEGTKKTPATNKQHVKKHATNLDTTAM